VDGDSFTFNKIIIIIDIEFPYVQVDLSYHKNKLRQRM